MTTTPEYDAILARKLAEREKQRRNETISGYQTDVDNTVHKHTVMTESETAQEVAKTTEGIFSGTVSTSMTQQPNYKVPVSAIVSNAETCQPSPIKEGYMTTTGRLLKGKPGRKKGWRKVKA